MEASDLGLLIFPSSPGSVPVICLDFLLDHLVGRLAAEMERKDALDKGDRQVRALQRGLRMGWHGRNHQPPRGSMGMERPQHVG